MKKELSISLAHLPEEGKAYRGELDPSVLETGEKDLVKPDSPLFYDIFIQRFDDELLVRGYLETSLELTCVRSGNTFFQTFIIEDFSASVEIDSGTIMLTDTMREEIFIGLPMNPECDKNAENSCCKLNSEYLTVDKDGESGVKQNPVTEKEQAWSNNWDALDSVNSLELPSDNH